MPATYPLHITKRLCVCRLCEQPIPKGAEANRVKSGLVHPACLTRRQSLLSSAELAERLGVSPAVFLKLAAELDLKPEAYRSNPVVRSGADMPLWPPEMAETLAVQPALAAARERSQQTRAARQNKAQARRAQFAARYPDWRAALLPAVEALFNLNRYAKWPRCSAAHRREIYELKNGLVRWLCWGGYCVAAVRHRVHREASQGECYGCDGLGCERCRYTGEYRQSRAPLVYIAFRFEIEGQKFAWHQPQALVTWPVTLTPLPAGEAPTWEPEGEKPVALSSGQFADAKALVRYVLEAA